MAHCEIDTRNRAFRKLLVCACKRIPSSVKLSPKLLIRDMRGPILGRPEFGGGLVGAKAMPANLSATGKNEIWMGDFLYPKYNNDCDFLSSVIVHEDQHINEPAGMALRRAELRAYRMQTKYLQKIGRKDLAQVLDEQIRRGQIIRKQH